MVLKEFRINHSTLIEHYQFIEAHLEGIYAALSGKSFADGIREIEKDSLSGVIRELKILEKEKNITIFTAEEYKQLRKITERRNFWCHCCYFELSFDLTTGALARVRDEQDLLEDMEAAQRCRSQLLQKKKDILAAKQIL